MSQHPKYADMILAAVKALGGKGASRQAINKYVVKEFNLTENKHHHAMLNQALKKCSAPRGILVHSKGKGAAGSFKVRAAVPESKTKKPAAKTKPKQDKKKPAKKSPKKASQEKPKDTKPASKPESKPEATVDAPSKPKSPKVKKSKKSKAASPKKPKVVKPKKAAPKKAAPKKKVASKK